MMHRYLSRADIGIAMGALGSDAAIEAADIVLMDDDPLKISKAIKIAQKCIRIVYENIYFAIGIKIDLPDPWSFRYCKHVDGNLCRRRCYGHRSIKCDPYIICKEFIEICRVTVWS